MSKFTNFFNPSFSLPNSQSQVEFIEVEASQLPNLSTTSSGGSSGSIVIGDGAVIQNNRSSGLILIGEGAQSDGGGTNGIGIGSRVQTTLGGVAIGVLADVQSVQGIAIGVQAVAINSESIQLGTGVNSSAKTLQVYDNTIANAQGLVSNYNPSNYSPNNVNNIDSHFEAIDSTFEDVVGDLKFVSISYRNNPAAIAFGGSNNIAIGSSQSTGLDNIGIGSVNINEFSPSVGDSDGRQYTHNINNVVIGANLNCNYYQDDDDEYFGSENNVLIGNNINIRGRDNIVLGKNYVNNNITDEFRNNIVIGNNNNAPNNQFLAQDYIIIGHNSTCSAGSIQLGTGNNTVNNSLQFRDVIVADTQGLYTSFTNPTSYTPSNNNNVDSHLAGIDKALATSGGEPYVEINSTGTLPVSTGGGALAIGGFTTSTSINSIAIGTSAKATSINSLALGVAAEATGVASVSIGNKSSSNSVDSVSLGHTAVASNREAIAIGNDSRGGGRASIAIGNLSYVTADNSVQIGEGTNSTLNTLQFRSTRIANNEGLYTSFINPVNYTPVDTDNVTSHLEAIDQKLGESEVPTFHRTNRQDLSSNITLNNESKGIQHLLNKTGTVLTVNLPPSPNINVHFIIKNRADSTEALYVNGITLAPGELWNGIWDGIEWMEI